MNWDALTYTPLNAQFVTALDGALLDGDTATIAALLAWRTALVTVEEFGAHCDRHMYAHYAGEPCRRCQAEAAP